MPNVDDFSPGVRFSLIAMGAIVFLGIFTMTAVTFCIPQFLESYGGE